MASHVVVFDNTLRRHQVKTTPAKHLTDVLQEACTKFGLDPSQHTLKHNEKNVDLSRTIRLSGLQPGAKLTLVQASRSPSVVNVALQLPPTSDSSGNLSRLTEKFPSNTSVWQVLRRFESGVAGGASAAGRNINITQRATPQLANGTSTAGSGRLFYEMPTINIMGRELSTFADLQKTLAQLGYNSGSALLRLVYRNTQQPLEEAMAEISQFFQEVEKTQLPVDTPVESAAATSTSADSEAMDQDPHPPSLEPTPAPEPPKPAAPEPTPTPIDESQPATELSFFAPPSSSTPQAATHTSHNDSDYVPTVDHAKLHQARLEKESRNKRLASDAELAAQEQARQQALAEVSSVHVRLRFPDQSSAQQPFDRAATVHDVYELCRRVLHRPNAEGFTVRVAGQRGAAVPLAETQRKLIGDLGWKGGVLVTVVWNDDVTMDTRRAPALKPEFRSQAKQLKVEEPVSNHLVEEKGQVVDVADAAKGKGKDGAAGDKEARMRRLLGKLTKK